MLGIMLRHYMDTMKIDENIRPPRRKIRENIFGKALVIVGSMGSQWLGRGA